ncbi:hypothetical protein IAQ61_000283, partial [Plenodomus lingam]|uniref:uncharacterized protein n=1 Tax=Leptosphaeria maculans TaxID=5022 RepID=UPI0033242C6E
MQDFLESSSPKILRDHNLLLPQARATLRANPISNVILEICRHKYCSTLSIDIGVRMDCELIGVGMTAGKTTLMVKSASTTVKEHFTTAKEPSSTVESASTTRSRNAQVSDNSPPDNTKDSPAMFKFPGSVDYYRPDDGCVTEPPECLSHIEINEWAEKVSRWKPGHRSLGVFRKVTLNL